MEVRLLRDHNHFGFGHNALNGVLGVVAKNLAKSLDKGLCVEYLARVLIVSFLSSVSTPRISS